MRDGQDSQEVQTLKLKLNVRAVQYELGAQRCADHIREHGAESAWLEEPHGTRSFKDGWRSQLERAWLHGLAY